MTRPPETDRIFRAGRLADAPTMRAILVKSNLSAPEAENLDRVTHSRVGEVPTFVVEEYGQVVAVLEWRNLGEEAEILDLAVHPNHRRQGHATFLLRNFLQHMWQSAAKKIFLEVRESNAGAIALYKKFGFQLFGRRPNYYRNPEESALLMNLSPPA
jgi:ribosomal-protein-alanine acetyltransferase